MLKILRFCIGECEAISPQVRSNSSTKEIKLNCLYEVFVKREVSVLNQNTVYFLVDLYKDQ